MLRTALYTGSFDPITNGHLDVIQSARSLCDRLVIGIGQHPGKTSLFTLDEKAALIKEVCASLIQKGQFEIEVVGFSGLAVLLSGLAVLAAGVPLLLSCAAGGTRPGSAGWPA